MKLRDHPKLKGGWPPKWDEADFTHTYKTHPTGEEGVLKEVRPFSHGASGHLALLIEFDGEEHMAKIDLDDIAFLQALFNKLNQCVEMPLQQVGRVDLDF